MYFLAKKQGKYLVDPFTKYEQEFIVDAQDSSDNAWEKDSQDSNRESAEQNDYPDEELMNDSEGRSVDSGHHDWSDDSEGTR